MSCDKDLDEMDIRSRIALMRYWSEEAKAGRGLPGHALNEAVCLARSLNICRLCLHCKSPNAESWNLTREHVCGSCDES